VRRGLGITPVVIKRGVRHGGRGVVRFVGHGKVDVTVDIVLISGKGGDCG
tara:strand:- start:365 stop:514 length:150 start_codon:yes stop_codon:yes gene_type:complete